jgi:hypothetical protein
VACNRRRRQLPDVPLLPGKSRRYMSVNAGAL